MLTRICADNFRCLVNFSFLPQRVNLLVGENGSGKTTLFEVVWSIQSLLQGGDSNIAFPTASLTRWETRNLQTFELAVSGNGGEYVYKLEVVHDRARFTSSIRSESVQMNGRALYRFDAPNVTLFDDEYSQGQSFPVMPTRSFLAMLEPNHKNTKLMWLKSFLQSIWIVRLNPFGMDETSIVESPALGRDASNFTSWYRNAVQTSPEGIPALQKSLQEVMAGFRMLRLEQFGVGRRGLLATFSAAGDSGAKSDSVFDVSLNEMSEGQRALLVLYGIQQFAKQRVLCFDEPDNFVALQEIQPWLVALSDTAREGDRQVFIISHHPEVIDYLAADSAFHLSRLNGGPSRVRPLEIDRESGLKASEVIARGWDEPA